MLISLMEVKIMEKNFVDWLALTLVIIGGINWGLVGVSNFNLVSYLFGAGIVSRIIYTLVGISALYMVYFASK